MTLQGNKAGITIVTYGQARRPDLFIRSLNHYSIQNSFNYQLVGHAWRDKKASYSTEYWDRLTISDMLTRFNLPECLKQHRRQLVMRYEKDWPSMVSPNNNPLHALNSFLLACKLVSELEDQNGLSQMIIFLRTDASLDYALPKAIFSSNFSGAIYPIGFRNSFKEVHFNCFAMSRSFLQQLVSISKLDLDYCLARIGQAMVEDQSPVFCGEAFFYYLFQEVKEELPLLAVPFFISDRIVRSGSCITPSFPLEVLVTQKIAIYEELLKNSMHLKAGISVIGRPYSDFLHLFVIPPEITASFNILRL